MAVTYGFYNSSNGDRKYNALQFSRLFEGIIRDGVFSTVGGSLMVTAASNLIVNINSGRAWFNNTWTNNDAMLPLTLDPAEAILNRYDAIVLEVAPDERENRFKIVKGTPATTPIKPVMVKSGGIYQYPLAYIYVGKGVGSISQANISNAVGTTECPFITGAMQQVTTNAIVAQWEAEFDDWFSNVQSQLEGNVVTNLQNQINTKLTAAGGDGKDVVVTFTQGSDVHIASGEKLSVIFGKLLGKLKAINTAITNMVNGTTKLTPISHASTGTTYGVGTTANYGHCKTINGLTQASHANGLALSAYQGKVLHDKMKNYVVQTLTTSGNFVVPANVYELEVFAVAGGFGGSAGRYTKNGTSEGGSGGGGGFYFGHASKKFLVSPGQSIPYIIGAGGAGGIATTTSSPTGDQGGETSFDTLRAGSSSQDTVLVGRGGDAAFNSAGTDGTPGGNVSIRGLSPKNIHSFLSCGGGGGGGGKSSWPPGNGGASDGGGVGGKGGVAGAAGSNGLNATVYGCCGGGGGGAGASSPIRKGGNGGAGRQGAIYVGYYNPS